MNESTGWYSCQKTTAVIPKPHLEHGRTRFSWIWTKLESMPKGASTIGKCLEGCSEETLRNWDKRNLRSTNKLHPEWLICETMISFILSFPGKQNADQWGEVTWRFISVQYKEFADNAAIRWQYICSSMEQVVLQRRTWVHNLASWRGELGRLARTSPRPFPTLKFYLMRSPQLLQQQPSCVSESFIKGQSLSSTLL